jgi:hypothetical protein
MPDYQQSKIYKLWSPSKNLVYYGSTVQSLAQRLSKHKNNHKYYKEDINNEYCSSYLILDCEDYKMELMEEYPCNNKTQLCKKEGEYIKANECVNKCIPGRTQQQWMEDNKDKMAEQQKEYREDNKDKIAEYNRQWRKDNKDKIAEQRKKHREANKEAFNAYQKQYREKLKQNKNINL